LQNTYDPEGVATLQNAVAEYRPSASESWQDKIKTGYGEVESNDRIPLPHTLDGGHLNSKEAALH